MTKLEIIEKWEKELVKVEQILKRGDEKPPNEAPTEALRLQNVSGSFSAVECKDLMYYGTLKDGSVKIDDGTKHLDYFLLNIFDLAKESTRFNVKEAIKMFWDRVEALANYR